MHNNLQVSDGNYRRVVDFEHKQVLTKVSFNLDCCILASHILPASHIDPGL